MSDGERFTDEDLDNFRYGSEKYGEFLKFTAEQDNISKIENMVS